MDKDLNESEDFVCSECNASVSEDDKICPSCGVSLTELINENSENIILLKIFPNDFEAQIAKAQLNEAGIECLISGDNEGGMAPNLSLTSGIRILVKESDLENAIEILKAMEMY